MGDFLGMTSVNIQEEVNSKEVSCKRLEIVMDYKTHQWTLFVFEWWMQNVTSIICFFALGQIYFSCQEIDSKKEIYAGYIP